LNSMNAGAPANFVSYRLLLHDLDDTQVPFRRPDSEKFKITDIEIENIKSLVRVKLDNHLSLSTSSPDYESIRRMLVAYGYDFTSIKSGLYIKRIPNTDFIQVDFVSDNPELSALAANAFCDEFIRYSKSLKSERAGESVEFLGELVS